MHLKTCISLLRHLISSLRTSFICHSLPSLGLPPLSLHKKMECTQRGIHSGITARGKDCQLSPGQQRPGAECWVFMGILGAHLSDGMYSEPPAFPSLPLETCPWCCGLGSVDCPLQWPAATPARPGLMAKGH